MVVVFPAPLAPSRQTLRRTDEQIELVEGDHVVVVLGEADRLQHGYAASGSTGAPAASDKPALP